MKQRNDTLKKWMTLALFAALAYTATLVLRVPVLFLTLDAKDAVLVIAALLFGPAEGVLLAFLVAFLEFITVSTTGPWGLLMNFASSAAFAGMSALVYKRHRTANGALCALAAGGVLMTGLMMLLNLWITPFYMQYPREVVAALLPTVFLPFNFAKAMLNSAIALMLYKPVSVGLKRSRLLPEDSVPAVYRLDKKTVVFLLLALTLAVAGILILHFVKGVTI